MLVYPKIDPVALHLGPLLIRWYGLMYLMGFAAFILLGRYRIQSRPDLNLRWSSSRLEDALFYGVLGVILGGRLGYVFFYKPFEYLENPLRVFAVWEGGMSFHGGLLGVILAMVLFSRKHHRSFLETMDFIAPLVPLGLGFGRLGNFINGELWGRLTDMPWGIIFPHVDNFPRHPSQLYEMILEGLILFLIIWLYSAKPRPAGKIAGLFVLLYGIFRFCVEFTREPDNFLGLLALHLSMGQWLSLPLILLGLFLLIRTPSNMSNTLNSAL